MRFKKRLKSEEGLRQIDIAPLIDVIFLLLIFFMLTSSFIVMPGIKVKLPKAKTSQALNMQTLTITISSEDIVYIGGKPVVMDEIDGILAPKTVESVFIKADRDSSVGAIVRVWDICRARGIEKIGIGTIYDE